MDRSEIMEIRKIFKTYTEDGCPVNGFSGAFIDAEGNVKGSFGEKSFHKMDDPVKKRIFTFASKTISNNSVTLYVKPGSRDLFEKLNAEKGANKEIAEELCFRVAKAIRETGAENTYAVHVISYTYDAPCKTSDHRVIFDGSSDVIYTFFVCMICPVVSGKHSYGYFPEKGKFGMNPILRCVEAPVAGFVYPDFTGRTPDPDGVLYFRTEKLDISGPLFGEEAPAIPEKKPAKKKDAASDPAPEAADEGESTIEESGASDEGSYVYRPSNDGISSLDSRTLSMEDRRCRDIASERREKEEAGEKDRLRKQDKAEDKALSDKPVSRGKKIRVSGDTKGLERKMVNGVLCLIVPVSEAEIV